MNHTEGHDVSQKIDTLSDSQYSRVADEYLESISDELDLLAEDHDQLDFELSHGVLNITIPPNGSYVINKQPPNKQIWLSSPLSGPKRFDLVGGKWTYLRDGTQLSNLLAGELGEAVGIDLQFESVDQ
ncbi:Mitochondrial chaperone Frataxin [Scheffersomyces spartinae]|uniref:ferroxidase n=1 Tax=Scheffersomyces spartinae TaxID=45513 RepID=A0A9P7V5H7_9ASCO|nr:Mitochondrial chaperone Frataxin [Scheffersomyces spartinae]KAG7191578.1 Mitochondrial chaperone Frataxin [Scheffersomyces spartinae]